jgi:hypothetical protein
MGREIAHIITDEMSALICQPQTSEPNAFILPIETFQTWRTWIPSLRGDRLGRPYFTLTAYSKRS